MDFFRKKTHPKIRMSLAANLIDTSGSTDASAELDENQSEGIYENITLTVRQTLHTNVYLFILKVNL